MSGSAPTVKDLYKVVTADLAAFIAADKPKEHDSPRETVQHYLDRFVKSNATPAHHAGSHHHGSHTPSTPSSAGGHLPVTSTPVLGSLPSGAAVGTGAGASSNATASSTFATPGATGPPSSGAAGQRHANELWYQSLTNSAMLQHSNNLPFAFHRLSQSSSSSNSPVSSAPTSQNASTTGSPVIGGGSGAGHASVVAGGQGGAHMTASSHATPLIGPNSGLPFASSPFVQPTPTGFTISSSSANSSLAAQRFSAHLIMLYTQHGMGAVPIATIASRMIVYLTHLLPFLTPQLVVADWWDRLIEPSLQGEIKLEKDGLKACRDLVTECMVRDNLLDNHGSGTGSLLVAGDEEGQLDASLAMVAMPISQFVLRKYIKAAHRLNHRLSETDRTEQELHADGLNGPWPRGNTSSTGASGHAGHGSGSSGLGYTRSSSSESSSIHQRSEYPAVLQDMEKQQRLFSRARAVIRRKKDILVKNLETILFAYGGSVGRVKDFFSCLYTYFVGAKFRAEILALLCQFIRRQRVHLHQILATPLFDSLLLSLKYDTSPLIISLGLMTLIMLMPRIPNALNDRLPDLFLILSRILCWPRSRQQLMAVTNQDGANLTGQTIKSFDEFDEEGAKAKTVNPENVTRGKSAGPEPSPEDIEFEDIPLYSHGIRWRRYGPAVPGGTTEGAPDPTAIFSFLYGLFPCNLLQFLHSPRAYMKQALSPTGSPKQGSGSHVEGESAGSSPEGGILSPKDTSDRAAYIDEDLLKSRVQTLLKRHSLHPDLLTLTPEQEIINKARWQKLEPMEIVAMCVGLDVWSAGGLYGTGPVLRSIDGDRGGGGAPQDDSDEDEEDNEAQVAVSSVKNTGKPVDSASPSAADTQDFSIQSQAGASVESLGSEASEGTPIEMLAQEDFFGPHAVKDGQPRPLHPMAMTSFHRGHAAPTSGNSPSPRNRTRSKEVKMSQILRNFATLRGLDHDELLMDGVNKLPGPSLIMRERRPSILKHSEDAVSAASSPATSTTVAGTSVDHGDIPAEESTALITHSEAKHDSLLHPTAMATLVLQNQEYRKAIVHLERDLLMAKNELNFELFLKQQHIQQISKVHRAHVLDASVEAERQNLYNTCRSLKAQLQETKLLLEKEKNELEKRKNKQTHWDTELKNKMQTFRDERKQLQFEVERLKQDIQDTRQSQEIQERLLTDERKGTFHLKNTIEDLSPKLKRMEEYEKRIEEMTRQLVLWESEQTKTLEIQHQMEIVVGRWQSLELLLAAEKEEARTLRNRVSQQSQVMDDMRIQLTINEGHGPEGLTDTPSIGHGSEEDEDDHDEDEEHEEDEEERDGLSSRGGHEGDNDDSTDAVERERSIRRKASNSLLHRSGATGALDMNWPTTFTRSNSSQQGFEQQRRAAAMQEFMVREKVRWDQELQEAHNRWSREAMRNQQLEDRLLELQGQLETVRAIDVRQHSSISGGRGDHNGGHLTGDGGGEGGDAGAGAGGGGNVEDGGGGGTHMMDVPSRPQDVPYMPAMGLQTRTHDHYTDGDTDDGGIGSTGMIGRYSRHQNETEDEDDTVGSRMRSMRHVADSSQLDSSQLPPHPSATTYGSTLFGGKGKGTKQKSKNKWLQTPSTLERAQPDRGTYGGTSGGGVAGTSALQSHLGSHTPGIFDLGHRLSQQHQQQRRSGDSSSTTGSSSAAARATSGGLLPPMPYTRNMSHLSDGGSSDVTTASDSSSVRGERLVGDDSGAGAGTGSGITEQGSGTASGSASASGSVTSSKRSTKSRAEKERERERERIRLMSGMGPLVDPSKMYRNVRMF